MRQLLLLSLAACSLAQNSVPLARILDFEDGKPGDPPAGWSAQRGTAFLDDKVVHGGSLSARIERKPDGSGDYTGISYSIPVNFTGERVELRGYLRTSAVTGVIGMWLRVDGPSGMMGFDSIQGQGITGTNDWKEYKATVPLRAEGQRLAFGVLLNGTGTVWADDLQLLVDGKPSTEAPRKIIPKTVLDTDTEFDDGSKIGPVDSLSAIQRQNLVNLGKVWGFVKYHHPAVTSGKRHFDYDLFRVLPKILAAPDRDSANAAMLAWIDGLGEVPECKPCATLRTEDLHLRPDLAWIDDKASLGPALSARLRAIHTNRVASGAQFYVSQVPGGVGNPVLDRELRYPQIRFPDTGMQLLTLYRFWNIIRYWFPYRDVIGEDWDAVLAEVLPNFVLARDFETFQRETLKLLARVHDTHIGLSAINSPRPPKGTCQLAVVARFIGEQAVVSGYMADEPGKASGVKLGDVIVELDGKPVAALVKEWRPYYSASNDPTRLRDIARALTRGTCGDTTVRIRRGSEMIDLKTARVPYSQPAPPTPTPGLTHDLPGDTYQRLSPEIAYLKLSSIKSADVAKYIESAAGTKGLIIDIRNYPSQFVVFTLGQLLVDRPTDFVRFSSGDLANPGAFHWNPPITLQPAKPHYSGKVVILVDEISQSQAEYTAMAFRSVPGAKVIGSTTAGADGNTSAIPLPFGLGSSMSGAGVFYPDKRPTQRVGIVADIEVHPTIEGLRDGRDELLEAAKREILK